MSRVIFQPFKHVSGATELGHALDAPAMDAEFQELASVLNGGIDESNLAAATKFSTVSPGAPSVSTAIGAKYSEMPLTATVNEVGTDISYFVGYALSGSYFTRADMRLSRAKSLRVTLTVGATTIFDSTGDATTALPFTAVSGTWNPWAYTYEPGSPVSCSGNVILRLRYASAVPLYSDFCSTFKVPVL